MDEQMDDGLFHHDYQEHRYEENLKSKFDLLKERVEDELKFKAQQKPKKKINVMGGVNAFGIWVEEKVFRMKKKAFTLVEIMIVVAIIALLASIAIPKLTAAAHQAALSHPKIIKEGGGVAPHRPYSQLK